MIYYIMFFVTGVFIDYFDLKKSNEKKDIVFYILSMTLALGIGVFCFSNVNRKGIAEYIIKIFNLGDV